jgi:DNA-binding transcriptional LysR family regulator
VNSITSVSGVDLNLLAVLGALLEERNVTRAGARLRLSQPTMSGALARLRQHFGDELLVRFGREYRLTPAATRLLPVVREALEQVERTLSTPPRFDPATSERRFSIAICGQALMALSDLVRRVHSAAPRVRLDMWPVTTALMENGRPGWPGYDLLIAPVGFWPAGQPEVIMRDRLVYVADPANPALRDGALTVERLAALPHAVARLPQAELASAALERLGVTPSVTVTTGGWLPLPFLVAGTDLVAVVPERLARRVCRAAQVTVVEPPFGPVELAEAAWWHPLRATDPALGWLRATLREVASACAAPPAPEAAEELEVAGLPLPLIAQDRDVVDAAGGRGNHPPGPLHQQRHLVGDDGHVALGRGQHRQAGRGADGHDHHHPGVHLHHGLHHDAAIEHARGP